MSTTITLEVKDEAEGEAIQRAMEKPDVRAFVIIVGALLPFSKRMQGSILNFAADVVADREERARVKAPTSAHQYYCAKRLAWEQSPIEKGAFGADEAAAKTTCTCGLEEA